MSLNDSQLISLSFLVTLSFSFLIAERACGTNSNNRSGTQMNQQDNAQGGRGIGEGVWGGNHVRMEVSGNGATLEFDCAHGKVSEPLTLDRLGRFQAKGTFTREHGGPIRENEKAATQPAKYSGSIKDKTMMLSVTLTNSSESVGTFSLRQGSQGELVKCL